MYAKLVLSGATNPLQCIRDIGRLITSASPSISDLSGVGYSTSLSSVIDSTPAGWTYDGSNKATDTSAIAAGAADATWTTAALWRWHFSAPMLNNSSRRKRIQIKHTTNGGPAAATYGSFALIGNQFGDATTQVGLGYHQASATTGAANLTNIAAASMRTSSSFTHHVIANPRHVTIIQEGKGMHAVWETTSCDLNERFNTAAYVQYYHATAADTSVNENVGQQTDSANNIGGSVFNMVNLTTNTELPAADVSMVKSRNYGSFFQAVTNARPNSIDALGNPKYQISPIFFQMDEYGWPAQYVSGVSPVYWCRAGIGSSGDTVNIGGDLYTFFNVGAYGTAAYGVLLQTS